ncbi:hypothetical protein BJX63DRAFT_395658 [Aspergillus granulosus]|uniref:Uncharacterized protein n=1 Tax=Aspergillus granulosus TaxID=176169 RepID=A0ABR4HBP2_9EURO
MVRCTKGRKIDWIEWQCRSMELCCCCCCSCSAILHRDISFSAQSSPPSGVLSPSTGRACCNPGPGPEMMTDEGILPPASPCAGGKMVFLISDHVSPDLSGEERIRQVQIDLKIELLLQLPERRTFGLVGELPTGADRFFLVALGHDW